MILNSVFVLQLHTVPAAPQFRSSRSGLMLSTVKGVAIGNLNRVERKASYIKDLVLYAVFFQC